MSYLILARHGATSNNERGIWTGITDIDMSAEGYKEARISSTFLAKYVINLALCSSLQRSRHTAEVILEQQRNKNQIPLLTTKLLDEKNYGVFTGKNKEHVKKEVGENLFSLIRRSWDYKIENGESLQDVHKRIIPVHNEVITPILNAGKSVLVASHNNTLRAYVKELEGTPAEETHLIELGTAEVRVYNYDAGNYELVDKQIVGKVH